MNQSHPAWLARQRQRWMRPDAYRYVRPDWRRFVRPDQVDKFRQEFYERKYSPDQPRDDHGRWTEAGGGDTTELSAQRRRGPTRVMVNGRSLDATPAQAARLVIAEARARNALARVRELDPSWKPTPSFRDTVEGQITTAQAEAREADARLSELARSGIGPGPYAGDSVPARGPMRNFTAAERKKINDIGYESGCHTCGILNPGTKSGNFVPDHQPPNALNPLSRSQRLYPQCLFCSSAQGGWITGNTKAK